MEELLELRACIEQHRYDDALAIVNEMEEMSKEDKINKIGRFIKIILIHLIKQHAEQRTTRSWDTSIFNALLEISRTNKRRKAGGFYLTGDDMLEIITAYYPVALRYAALEAFGGRYETDQLEAMIEPSAVRQEAYRLLTEQGAV
jgi:hypothetical protein